MGKIRRVRQKYHTNVVKAKKDEDGSHNEEAMHADLPPCQVEIPATGLFDGIKINYDALVKKADLDRISVKSLKNVTDKQITKKEKRKLRHETFLKKIDAVKQARKEEKERKKKKKKKAPVVGDLQLLIDALPTLEQLKSKSEKRAKKKTKSTKFKPIEKAKKRQKEMIKGTKIFKQVLNHPSYKADPFGTILDHLKNTVKIENEKIGK